jgi:hypothetical protein
MQPTVSRMGSGMMHSDRRTNSIQQQPPLPESDCGLTRRETLGLTFLSAIGLCFPWQQSSGTTLPILPEGSAPPALEVDHFPTRVHAFVWRNWQLVSLETMASVLKTSTANVLEVGKAMGLQDAEEITPEVRERSALSVIRRNWHLLPYDQLLALLGWDAEKLTFALREDDFLFHKLGLLKPKCAPLAWQERTSGIRERETEIAQLVSKHFSNQRLAGSDPLFGFVKRLSASGASAPLVPDDAADEPLRFCYSYFALYGDPLLETSLDPYPDGYLEKLRAQGVNGIWLQGVLSQLAPFPWEPKRSEAHGTRLENLRRLVARAEAKGVRVFLYINEPRAMPNAFFDKHADLRGVTIDDHTMLCTSAEPVREWLEQSVAHICRQVPDLGGFFTITVSENPTNCWSHGKGAECPRCSPAGPATVIADVNDRIAAGIRAASGKQRLIVWDWAWKDQWAEEAISKLPQDATLMCVSEWSLPIERGGVASNVGEYCLSAIGPGPRAVKHWAAARARGLKVMAKIQAALSWEFSAAPYIPVLQNVAEHKTKLKQHGVEEMMLSWTLGGHPSPNFAAISTPLSELAASTCVENPSAVLSFWSECSKAFSEFPFHISVAYTAPLQAGPANLPWPEPTGYHATMVGFGYDDLRRWRGIYPPDVFITQLEKTADGFFSAVKKLKAAVPKPGEALNEQIRFAEVAALHWKSVALQARYVVARSDDTKKAERSEILSQEVDLAKNLHALQSVDARIGFEASNQYYYVPLDLIEKVIRCEWLQDRDV